MYICEECFDEFDEPLVWTEEHGETLSGCPKCRGNFVEEEEINRCKICGEPIDDDEVCCESCKSEIEAPNHNCKDCIFDHLAKVGDRL